MSSKYKLIHAGGYTPPVPDPALKGKKNGNCNRTACQQPGAVYYNRYTYAYYCQTCKNLIEPDNANVIFEPLYNQENQS